MANYTSRPTPSLSLYTSKNKAFWNKFSDEYEHHFGQLLPQEGAPAWGLWSIPEAELRLLGNVEEKDILDLGCGAAHWLIALARCGARPVGLDISARQLEHARRLMGEAGVALPLLEADAEKVPLPDASFDIVISNWGGLTTCNPERTLPEVARLLRPGGLLVFSTLHPIVGMCDVWGHTDTHTFVNDYFGMHQIRHWEENTDFVLPFGEWIRLFKQTGFIVLDMIETQPPPEATHQLLTTEEIEWARHWPRELIWQVRKEKGTVPSHEKEAEEKTQ